MAKRAAIVLTPELKAHLNQAHHDLVCRWARANGIDPNEVAMGTGTGVVVRDGQIHFDRFILTAAGNPQVRPDRDEALTEPATVPLVEPMPTEILELIAAFA